MFFKRTIHHDCCEIFPLRTATLLENHALNLYSRLEFVEYNRTDTHILIEWLGDDKHQEDDNMNFRVSREPLSIDEFHALCRSIGWKEISPENYKLAVTNSVASVSVFSDGEMVGSGRLVGDVGMNLYIQDVIVHVEHHGKGIVSRIVRELQEIVEELDCCEA